MTPKMTSMCVTSFTSFSVITVPVSLHPLAGHLIDNLLSAILGMLFCPYSYFIVVLGCPLFLWSLLSPSTSLPSPVALATSSCLHFALWIWSVIHNIATNRDVPISYSVTETRECSLCLSLAVIGTSSDEPSNMSPLSTLEFTWPQASKYWKARWTYLPFWGSNMTEYGLNIYVC